ncbi:YccF domain-containing protein, partial [Proteiniclasticum sp. C24MP]|uniref:YccF domain-containing protein n=1 Tax=Proteiniclasticum sp. C24MP TaxID=3374101 RepID=UPI0037550B7A
MSILGNLIWFMLGGFIPAILWFFFGLLWSITIIGIPVGVQCFKMAGLQLFPFGKDVSYSSMGAGSLLINILWIVIGGIELAVANVLIGIAFCMTIIGIPFGLQNFKMAKLSLMPFGAKII